MVTDRAAMSAPRPRQLTKADYEALADFRRGLRRFAIFSEHAARAAGLTPQQHQALLAIKGAPARETLSVGEIASALLIRPHSAAELVARLEQLRLVERRSDEADHRRVLVSLTATTEAILEELSAAHLQELHAIRPALAELLRRFERESEDQSG